MKTIIVYIVSIVCILIGIGILTQVSNSEKLNLISGVLTALGFVLNFVAFYKRGE